MTSPQRQRSAVHRSQTITTTVHRSPEFQHVDLKHQELQIDNENLKNILNGLNEKLTVYNDMKADVERHNAMLTQSEAGRAQDQSNLRRAEQQMREAAAANKAHQEKLHQEINTLNATIQQKDKEAFEAKKQHALEINNLNKLHAERQQQYVNIIDQLKDAHSKELAEVRRQHTTDCQERDQRHTAELDRLKADCNARCQQLQQQLNAKDKTIAQMAADHTTKQVQAQKTFEEWQKNINSKNFAQVMKLQTELSLLVKVKKTEIMELNQKMETQRVTYDKKVNAQDQQIKQLQTQVLGLQSRVSELETALGRLNDVEAQLRMSREHEEAMRLAKIELQNELTTASAYILQLQEEFYASKRTSLELLTKLKEMEAENESHRVEIETLRNYIIDLKSRIAVYIPVKNDQIDKRIAEYINNYPDRQKLKIMFMRESEGVYQFGSKRVAVKVDKDKINIRVGGGFLSIDEFLDQYTPAELEKLERKDPMKRFAEKVSVSKTIQGHMVRDSSPVSPQKSPSKRAI